MIIDTAPQNKAVLSNVGQIGEFRIRNSAKAFNILSSGLYANKVKAIIRELSCNAIDSQVAAGNNVPFEVHLPNALEPYFSIRDFGTGLSHEQVNSIYTTYFESTKTNSNDFIGALGLGSKSPFSYTDNFTVTAIKDGRKGVYTAFINGEGVPSIALMTEEDTTDPSGVEIKFSVNERYDFEKFRQEARNVYSWFKVMPIVKGYEGFKTEPIEYKDKDIIPGVHSIGDHRKSMALMGNIAYPINIPESDKSIGELEKLLECGLVIEFGIGELDFQASREGLSYIPQTIEAIKRKLVALNERLTVHIAEEADKIQNLWERAVYLSERSHTKLWSNAVDKYVTDTNFELLEKTGYSYGRYSYKKFNIPTQELCSKYNIVLRGFSKDRHRTTCSAISVSKIRTDMVDAANKAIYEEAFPINVGDGVYFVINDTNVGAFERAKYHWRKNGNKTKGYSEEVFIVDAADKTKPVKTEEFFKSLFSPPNILKASSLDKKERVAGLGKNVSILKLEKRNSYNRWSSSDLTWKDAGSVSQFDDKTTHYYIPLSGFTSLINYDTKQLTVDLKEGMGITIPLYGVRKGDIEEIKKLKNWVNVEVYMQDLFANLDQKLVNQFCRKMLDMNPNFCYNSYVAAQIKNSNSPYLNFTKKYMNVDSTKLTPECFNRLSKVYGKGFVLDTTLESVKAELNSLSLRYPLLRIVETHRAYNETNAISEYINLIDSSKGV